MYRESVTFHKYTLPIFLGICLILFLTGCSAFSHRATIDTENPIPRTKAVINCMNEFLAKDVKAKTSYDICKDIFKRGE